MFPNFFPVFSYYLEIVQIVPLSFIRGIDSGMSPLVQGTHKKLCKELGQKFLQENIKLLNYKYKQFLSD